MKAISGIEMTKVLENKGWRLLRVHGSHHLYGRGSERIAIPIHGHRILKNGLQRALMKQAGLSDEDL